MFINYPKAIDFKNCIAPIGFTNINDIFDLTNADWLHPVQSLFGNWNAKILILGQDYNGVDNLNKSQISDLRHDPKFQTNINLIKVFGSDADALYANFFWFIKDGDAQKNFSTRKEVVEANLPIFNSTLKAMKNLSYIFPLGSVTTTKAFGIEFKPLTTSNLMIGNKSYIVMPIPHLGNRGLGNFSRKNGLTKADALQEIKQAITILLSK